jgi:hydroxymethylpyrimidine pyrophosphatase-like HAD family hydrolase
MELKGYLPKNTIVFGDNFNDIGMFSLAGTVVVVENAPEEIKKLADYIVPSNLEGGVLQFIEEHLDELV